jgi:hypothetical protein
MSILFHYYKELKKCMEEVKQLEAKCSNEKGGNTIDGGRGGTGGKSWNKILCEQ